MEENQYRDTYHNVNQLRCIFEKSINSRRCQCSLAHRFCLADREGVSCSVDLAQTRCQTLLNSLRHNASFTMRLTRVEGALPHARELKVQVGGLLGLQHLIQPGTSTEQQLLIQDIHRLINSAIEKYTTMDNFPYDEVVKEINKFEGRAKRVKSR